MLLDAIGTGSAFTVLGFLAAMVVGIILGLVGGGGSILAVPVFVYLMGIPPALATAYSLFVVGVSAAVGGFQKHRAGQVDWKTGLAFAFPSLISVYITRRYLLPALPDSFQWHGFSLSQDTFIMGLFALLMVAASVSMIRGGDRGASDEPATHARDQRSAVAKWTLIGVEGLVVGALTGLVGAGGGFLIIPALVVLVGMPMKTAVGTSLVIIALKSTIGFLGDLGSGQPLDWGLILGFTGLTVLGMALGLRWAQKVDGTLLKKGFGWFVLVLGIIILLGQA
jgi:uncharacterized membrane protein YfcA